MIDLLLLSMAAMASTLSGTTGDGLAGHAWLGDSDGGQTVVRMRQSDGGDDRAQSEQERAFRAAREGRAVPLPVIERRIVPMMGDADYLGPEMRGSTYRLKFVSDGRVVWIDVDAATGRVIRASGR